MLREARKTIMESTNLKSQHLPILKESVHQFLAIIIFLLFIWYLFYNIHTLDSSRAYRGIQALKYDYLIWFWLGDSQCRPSVWVSKNRDFADALRQFYTSSHHSIWKKMILVTFLLQYEWGHTIAALKNFHMSCLKRSLQQRRYWDKSKEAFSRGYLNQKPSSINNDKLNLYLKSNQSMLLSDHTTISNSKSSL